MLPYSDAQTQYLSPPAALNAARHHHTVFRILDAKNQRQARREALFPLMTDTGALWFDAVALREYEAVKKSLSEHKGATNANGLTALHLAAQMGDIGLVRILAAAERGIHTPEGLTAYMLAVIGGHREAAEFLFQFEGTVKTTRNKTLLHVLAERGLAGELDTVVDKHPNDKDCNGNTAMETALLASQLDTATILLRKFPLDLQEAGELEAKFRDSDLQDSISFVDRLIIRLERDAISKCKDCNYFRQRLDAARRELNKQQRYCEDIKRILQQPEGTPLDAARAAMRAFKEELEEKMKIQRALDNELRMLRGEAEKSKRALAQTEAQLQEIRSTYSSEDGRTARDMDRHIRELLTKIESLQADNSALKATLQDVRTQLKMRDERVLTISTQLAEQSRANSALARVHSMEKERCSTLELQVRTLQGSLHALEENNEQLVGTIVSQEQNLNSLTTTVTQLAAEKASNVPTPVPDTPVEYKEMHREILEISGQLHQSRRDCEELQGVVAALRESEQEYLRVIQEKAEENTQLASTIKGLEAERVNLKAKISILEGQVAVYVEELKARDESLGAKNMKMSQAPEQEASRQVLSNKSSRMSVPVSSVMINPPQTAASAANISHMSNFSVSNMSNASINIDCEEEDSVFAQHRGRKSMACDADGFAQLGGRRSRPLSASAITGMSRTGMRRMDGSLTTSMLNPVATSTIVGAHGMHNVSMNIGTVTYKGQTPDDTLLMQAAAVGDLGTLQQMMHEIRRVNTAGMTALMLATLNRQRDAIIKLISQESGMQNNNGETALMIAVRTGYHEGVNLLAMKEARCTKPDGTSALYLAIEANNEVAARMLARYEGVDVRDFSMANFRFNELMEAASHDDIVTCYLLMGPQGRLVDENGRTALMYAAIYGAVSAAKLLSQLQLQARDKYGNTALMYAAELGYQDIIEVLKGEAGMSNRLGETALIKAIRNGHINCVGSLFFAEHNIRTARGESPVDIAASLGTDIPQEVKSAIVSFLTDLQNRLRL